jgi:hypothetical protein
VGPPAAAPRLRPQLEFHRPIGGNPTPGRWRRFIDHLLELGEDPFDLLVIDTVMSFLPATQNQPDSLWRALQRGCELGVLVRTGAGTRTEALRYGLAAGSNPVAPT